MESELKEFLEAKNNILLVPDPENKLDTLAASFALALVLEQMGKVAYIYFEQNLPQKLGFLNIERFVEKNPQKNGFSLMVDTSLIPVKNIRSQKQGNILKFTLHTDQPVKGRGGISLQNNSSFWNGVVFVGSDNALSSGNGLSFLDKNTPILNLKAEQNSSSVSETLTRYLKEGGEKYINEEVATTLLTGIVAATQNFQAPSLKPQSLFGAAYLIAKNAKNEAIVRHLYKTKSLDSVKLWGSVISNFTFNAEKKIGWTFIDKHNGLQKSHIAPLINELKNNFAQAEIFILGIEEQNNKTAVIHASNTSALKPFTQKHSIPLKNSSCMVRLNPVHDIRSATEKLAQELENSL